MSSNTPPKDPQDPFKKPENVTKEPKDEPKEDRLESLYTYSKSNARDLIAYVMLVFGIIMLFFLPLYGQLLIGIVFGLYFSKEITYYCKNYEACIEQEGIVRSIVIGATLLAFFISAPAIFIGAAIIVGLKYFILTAE